MNSIKKLIPNSEKDLKRFKSDINNLLNNDIVQWKNVRILTYSGLYFVLNKNNGFPVYIGKSDKLISKRVYNLLHSHRNHTFNNKKLKEKWKKKTNTPLQNFHKYKVEELKNSLKKNKIDWLTLKKGVNKNIKEKYTLKCLPIKNKSYLVRVEHFAIALFNPKYNDKVKES